MRTSQDFQSRLEMTPIPTYSPVAIDDVRNSIFQRMRDITRRGGSQAFQRASTAWTWASIFVATR